MVKQQHQFFVAMLCLVDGLVIAAACYTAWALPRLADWTAEHWWPRSWENWIKEPLILFTVPIALYAMRLFGLYRARRDRSLFNEMLQILKASIAAVGGLVVLLWALGNAMVTGPDPYGPAHVLGRTLDAGRLQLGLLAVCLPLFLGAHRAVFRTALRELRRRGRNLRHVAVIGVGRLGQIVSRTLSRNSWTGLNVAYFVSHHGEARKVQCQGRPVMGGLHDLERVLEAKPVDAVYLAIPNAYAAEVPRLLQRLEKYPVDVRIVPDVLARYVPESMAVSELDGMPILSYRESPTTGLGGVSKRAIDILGASVALVLFSPLFLAIAVLVRVTSPGPVIFKQRRMSLGKRTFKIYKFRTMYQVLDESRAAGWTQRNDPRVTPIGRWLRRTSLDELPQLLNVLKGQMSLVGPRPERPELIRKFREDWRGYMLRQHVKAGITGWAQVNGYRGDTGLRKRLQYDLFYVKNWSLWFDVKILWLTVLRGFVHPNAH